MFGATVLVPLLTGLDPAVALFTSGTGTLLFQIITKGQVPAYLGSSFAFIGPFIAVAGSHGLPYALGGGLAVGLVYALVGLLVSRSGVDWIDRFLPPVVIGSVIMVIGLIAPTAVEMRGCQAALASPEVRISLFTIM